MSAHAQIDTCGFLLFVNAVAAKKPPGVEKDGIGCHCALQEQETRTVGHGEPKVKTKVTDNGDNDGKCKVHFHCRSERDDLHLLSVVIAMRLLSSLIACV